MPSPFSLSRRQLLLTAASLAAAAETPSSEPCYWTLTEAAAQLRRRKISSEELTKLALDRVRQRNDRLSAYLTVTAESALAQARAADRALHQGAARGLLHGVPIALKDNIDTAGIKTTAASEIFKDRVPTEDAEVVQRLSRAGIVMLGKLNLDEWAFEGTGTTSYFGPVRNPWNTERITGGSSAGSAAALADGLCYASVGSDDGGSVRIPGSYCGVVGFKPSYGRVSTRGVIPSAYSLDCVGPMTRSVEDAAAVLAVIAGFDPKDSITLDRPVPDYAAAIGASISGLRIGIPRDYFFEQLHPDVAARVEDAIRLMRPKVKEVRDVTLPRFQFVENGSYDVELYHYHKQFFDKWPEKYHPWSREQMEELKKVTAERYVETLKRIREARRDVRAVFEQVDALLLPTMREPAPPIEGIINRTHKRLPSNVSAFNRFGLPALTLPCGFSGEGLPIGLQVVGPSFGESTVLSVAYAYQQATNWHLRHPV